MANAQDLRKAEDFYKAVLSYYNPDFGLSETDPLYDILVRPATLFKLPELIAAAEASKSNRSLLQTAADTTSYDQLLANFFIPRNTGSVKSVVFRAYFPTNLVPGKVAAGTQFTAGSGVFVTTADLVISPASYVLETQVPYAGKYYIDISTRSNATGTFTDVIEGVSGQATLFRATDALVVASAEGGADAETNEQAFVRGKKLISLRNWVSDLSINGQLALSFPSAIRSALVVGFLEPEMVRDRVAVVLPKHMARLFFSSKVGLSLPSATTRIRYGDSPIVYKPLVDEAIGASSTRWVSDSLLGEHYVDIEVVLVSLNNPRGFRQDTPLQIDKSVGGGFSPLSIIYPSFLGGRAQVSARTDDTGEDGTVIHIGSHTDIYIRPEVQTKTVQIAVPSNSSGFVAIPDSVKPVLRIEEILDEFGEPVSIYNLLTTDPFLRFSGKDDTSLFVNPGLVGTTISLTVSCAPLVRSIQSHIDNSIERVVDTSTLVKYYFPIFVNGVVQVSLESALGENPEATFQAVIADMFSNMGTGGAVTKDMVIEVLRTSVPNIREVVSVDIEGVQYFPDGSIVSSITPDTVAIEPDTVWGITERNTCFEKGTWEFIFIT